MLQNELDLFDAYYGANDTEGWLVTDLGNPSLQQWESDLSAAVSDSSEGGVFISRNETAVLLGTAYDGYVPQDYRQRFIARWNNGWNASGDPSAPAIDFPSVQALYSKYVNDTALVRAAGYLSPADATLDAYSALVNDANRAGTCAQVTIVIKQTLLLTRTAVSAPLTPVPFPKPAWPHTPP